MAAPGKLSPESQQSLDAYLNEVAGVLFRSGLERRAIEGILGDIRAQVHEMLASRYGDAPTPDNMREVIAGLDSPESYAVEPEAEKLPAPRFSRLAILGACWGAFFFALISVFFEAKVVRVQPGHHYEPTAWEMLLRFTVLPLGLSAPAACTILGLIAIARIRHCAGRMAGMSLAVADALFFPLLALNGLFFWGIYTGFQIWLERGQYARDIVSLSLITTFLLSLTVDFIIARQVWKAANRA